MRTRYFLAAMGLASLTFGSIHPVAAQADDDQSWLRQCQRDSYGWGSDNEHVCEIRHSGFKPTGTTLSIDPDENGGAEIIGWDKDSVAVTARIQANAPSEDEARELAQQIKINGSGSSISVDGPSTGRHEGWGVILVVMVPRKSGIDAETVNGPLSVENLSGTIDLRAENGPVAIENVGGDVRARVQNGPLDVTLTGTKWEGKGLDAESVNGPVSLQIPQKYNAELETGTVNGPMTVNMPLTVTLKGRVTDRIHTTLGAGGAPIRVVTTNGPLTIQSARD